MANIFEQYGIKEVADVTIYAIDLDKYDNEMYIPIMYLDTLKVSTLEQTADQSTAKGGKGNPDLITWDFGKEISLSLEDALFTPASQSLMWGGKFGIKKPKVKGLWNPKVYPKDAYGRIKYIEKRVLSPLSGAAAPQGDGWYFIKDGKIENKVDLDQIEREEVPAVNNFYSLNRCYPFANAQGGYDATYFNYPSIKYYTLSKDNSSVYIFVDDTLIDFYATMLAQTEDFIAETVSSIGDGFDQDYQDYIDTQKLLEQTEVLSEHPEYEERDLFSESQQFKNIDNYSVEALKQYYQNISNNKGHYVPLEVIFSNQGEPDWSGNEGTNTISLIKMITIAEEDYVDFICPCDGETKKMGFFPVSGDWRYEDITNMAVGYKCPKGYDTGERLSSSETSAQLVKSYYWNMGNNSIYNQLKERKQTSVDYKGRPERAEIILDNYNQFSLTPFDMSVLRGQLDSQTGIITLNDSDNEQFCIYTPIESCDQIIGDMTTACGNDVKAYGYEWKKVDMKMVSLEGEQDMYYLENANLRYRVPRNSTQKEIMIARQGLYSTVAAVSDNDLETLVAYEQAIAEDYEWKKANNIELVDVTDITDSAEEYYSYGYFINQYDSSIDFYLNIRMLLPISNNSEPIEKVIRVLLGRYFIIADWNYSRDTAYDFINPIESGMEDVSTLERMEKCKAPRTFAIDTNKNLLMANYRYTPEYEDAALTVYIDPKTMKPYEPNSGNFTRENGDIITGNLRIIKQHEVYYKWTRTIAPKYTSLGNRIVVDAEHFPGTYRIVGETYARGRNDGKDEKYQFEIPLAKLSADTNLTLQADGDPTTFTMNFKIMRRDDGVMVKLTQYNVDCNYYDGYASGSTKVIPIDALNDFSDILITEEEEKDIKVEVDSE